MFKCRHIIQIKKYYVAQIKHVCEHFRSPLMTAIRNLYWNGREWKLTHSAQLLYGRTLQVLSHLILVTLKEEFLLSVLQMKELSVREVR